MSLERLYQMSEREGISPDRLMSLALDAFSHQQNDDRITGLVEKKEQLLSELKTERQRRREAELLVEVWKQTACESRV